MIKSLHKLHELISQNVTNKVIVSGVATFKRLKMKSMDFQFSGNIVGVTDIHDHEFTVSIYKNGILGSVTFYSERKSCHDKSNKYTMTGFKMDGVPDIASKASPMITLIDPNDYVTSNKYRFWCHDMCNGSDAVIDNILDDVYDASILPDVIPRDKYQLFRITEADGVLHLIIMAFMRGYYDNKPYRVKYTTDQRWERVGVQKCELVESVDGL